MNLSPTLTSFRENVREALPRSAGDDACDDLIDVLQSLQEFCDWSTAHKWSAEKMRGFLRDFRGDIGYAMDIATSIKLGG